MRRAVDMGLPDRHLFRALFDTGTLEKKLGLEHAALATFTDLSLSPNPFQARAYEELAKHYEHRERNYRMALECTGLEETRGEIGEGRERRVVEASFGLRLRRMEEESIRPWKTIPGRRDGRKDCSRREAKSVLEVSGSPQIEAAGSSAMPMKAGTGNGAWVFKVVVGISSPGHVIADRR